jgi:hypothetical protein
MAKTCEIVGIVERMGLEPSETVKFYPRFLISPRVLPSHEDAASRIREWGEDILYSVVLGAWNP